MFNMIYITELYEFAAQIEQLTNAGYELIGGVVREENIEAVKKGYDEYKVVSYDKQFLLYGKKR